jgi:hypothetical protein
MKKFFLTGLFALPIIGLLNLIFIDVEVWYKLPTINFLAPALAAIYVDYIQ